MLNPTTKTPLKSLITGAGGQSAYWLAKDLTAHGRQVFRCSSQGLDLKLPYGDAAGIWRVLSEMQPEEIYHLA
jgi:GDP-D-mannose dehydratase